jgi:hypothetical protein
VGDEMSKVRVVPTELRSLAGLSAASLREALRFDEPTVVAVRHTTFAATTLLVCPPRDWVWRGIYTMWQDFPQRWNDLLTRELIDEGQLLIELKAHGLSTRAMPAGFWYVNDAESFESKDLRVGLQNVVLMVPNDTMASVVQYVEQWVEQTKDLGLVHLPDLEFLRVVEAGGSRDAEGSGDGRAIFGGLSTAGVTHWRSPNGLIAQLERAVARLEAGEPLDLHPVAIQCASEIGVHREMAVIRSRPAKRGRLSKTQAGSGPLFDMRDIDLILALRARAVRLLGWPQLYRAVKRELVQEERYSLIEALTPALPYEPFEEMRAFLHEMDVAYPIVREVPFPAEHCPSTLL